jgi:hypothetical protein
VWESGIQKNNRCKESGREDLSDKWIPEQKSTDVRKGVIPIF